ncbi:MAG: MBL fold metallo-hydrolase [Alphaproteobacteria bacterium]|jgi:glyoxylase-like metal-dependent hydrolase (beta-lactamase superfamily II)|nr:MBL fold metallo-hydrolase [Alphaproteobacteria bacterium]
MAQPRVRSFFHQESFTFTHVVAEPDGAHCAIIDSVLDYDPKSGRTATIAADQVIGHVREQGLVVDWILETHPHADHLTAAPYLQAELGGRIAIGAGITRVQETFKAIFNLADEFATDGSQFDRRFADGDSFEIGAMTAAAWSTPGHTPSCLCYLVGDTVFVGDTIFMPDFGSARCDFPGGDPRLLYRSVRRLLALPPETRMFMCHDYGPEGREYRWETSVAEQRAGNRHLNDDVDEAAFVRLRGERDAELEMPALLLPAVQVNIRAGRFPPPEDNGVRYLKLPLNAV